MMPFCGKAKEMAAEELSWATAQSVPKRCEEYFEVLLSDLPYFPLRCAED